jgi:adenylate kinase family enzyme
MSSWAPESASRLRAAMIDTVARSGVRPPLVLIDGPSGAGKSSLADLLVQHWPGDVRPQLVRMDDIYPGWDGLDSASAAIGPALLAPFAAGTRARWQRWDWVADAPAEWHAVADDRPLIVEGCGTLARTNAALADLAIWLDADDALRKERALARDGMSFATHWDRWQHDFERYVEREHPRANATLTLDVSGWPLGVRAPLAGQG